MPDIMEAVLRTAIAFGVVVLFTEMTGAKQLSQLTFTDLIMGTAVGGMAALAAAGLNINIWGTVAALITFSFLLYLKGYVFSLRKPMRKIIKDEPVLVISEGRILENNLSGTGCTPGELLKKIEEMGQRQVSEMKFAVIKPDGKIEELIQGPHHTLKNEF